jgi:hypothetical protein
MTPGGQWRISQQEVMRLKREGLPQIPRRFPTGSTPAFEVGITDHAQEMPSGPESQFRAASANSQHLRGLAPRQNRNRFKFLDRSGLGEFLLGA